MIDNSNLDISNVPFLFQTGVDVVNETTFDLAIREKRMDIAEFILKNGFDINSKIGSNLSTYLHWHVAIPNSSARGVCRRNVEILRWLLDHGADVNAKDDRGLTPIQYALEPPRVSNEVISELIRRGADLKVIFGNGMGLVAFSRDNGANEIVDMLLKAGAPDM